MAGNGRAHGKQWQSTAEGAVKDLEGGGAEEVRLDEVELVVDDRKPAREEVDHALELR
jgi:hypothetical protein